MSQRSAQTFFSHKRVTLSGGQTRQVKVTGTYFMCSEATAGFWVSFDGRERIPFNVGIAVRFLPGDFFSDIELVNTSDQENTIEFYTGSAEIIDARLNVVKERPDTVPITIHPPQTRIQTHNITSLTSFQEEACPGTDAAGKLRKELLVTNLDPVNDLDIRTPDGTSIGMVLARTAWVLETSADLKVVNPNASTIACRVSEVFYTA